MHAFVGCVSTPMANGQRSKSRASPSSDSSIGRVVESSLSVMASLDGADDSVDLDNSRSAESSFSGMSSFKSTPATGRSQKQQTPATELSCNATPMQQEHSSPANNSIAVELRKRKQLAMNTMASMSLKKAELEDAADVHRMNRPIADLIKLYIDEAFKRNSDDKDFANPEAFSLTPRSQSQYPLNSMYVTDLINLGPGGWTNDAVVVNCILLEMGDNPRTGYFCPPLDLANWIGEGWTHNMEMLVDQYDETFEHIEKSGEMPKVQGTSAWPAEKMPVGSRYLLFPLNTGSHWATIKMEPNLQSNRGVITVYDSLSGHCKRWFKILLTLARLVSKRIELGWSNVEWSIQEAKASQQKNTSDCGLLTAYNCTQLLQGLQPEYSISGESMNRFGEDLRYLFLCKVYPLLTGEQIPSSPVSDKKSGATEENELDFDEEFGVNQIEGTDADPDFDEFFDANYVDDSDEESIINLDEGERDDDLDADLDLVVETAVVPEDSSDEEPISKRRRTAESAPAKKQVVSKVGKQRAPWSRDEFVALDIGRPSAVNDEMTEMDPQFIEYAKFTLTKIHEGAQKWSDHLSTNVKRFVTGHGVQGLLDGIEFGVLPGTQRWIANGCDLDAGFDDLPGPSDTHLGNNAVYCSVLTMNGQHSMYIGSGTAQSHDAKVYPGVGSRLSTYEKIAAKALKGTVPGSVERGHMAKAFDTVSNGGTWRIRVIAVFPNVMKSWTMFVEGLMVEMLDSQSDYVPELDRYSCRFRTHASLDISRAACHPDMRSNRSWLGLNNADPLLQGLQYSQKERFVTAEEQAARKREKRETAIACTRRWYYANRGRANAQTKAWTQANPERRKANLQAWNRKHEPEIKAYMKDYREKHKDKSKAYHKVWWAAGKDEINAKRRATRNANKEEFNAIRRGKAEAKRAAERASELALLPEAERHQAEEEDKIAAEEKVAAAAERKKAKAKKDAADAKANERKQQALARLPEEERKKAEEANALEEKVKLARKARKAALALERCRRHRQRKKDAKAEAAKAKEATAEVGDHDNVAENGSFGEDGKTCKDATETR